MAHIVVGVDGSDNSRHALEWAMAEANLRHERLDIVSCWEYPMLIASEIVWAAPPAKSALIEAALARAGRLIDGLKLSEAGVSFAVITPEGRAGVELVREAADAEMLVVGSRGSGSTRELLLGSVSNYCVHHARCPVVIIRPPA